MTIVNTLQVKKNFEPNLVAHDCIAQRDRSDDLRQRDGISIWIPSSVNLETNLLETEKWCD